MTLNKKMLCIFFYIALIVLCLACSVKGDIIDVDFWSRLIMGKHVVETGSVMYHDIISYTPTHIWYDHEWISSALFYFVTEHFGAFGLTILKCLINTITICLIFLVIQYKQNSIDIKYKHIYLLLVVVLLSQVAFFKTLRCQNFSFLFYPVLFLILEYTRRNYKSKLILLTPFLMLLWLNIHGASMYAMGIIFLYGLGEALNRKPCLKYFLILIPCALVYFINPWGADFVNFMIGAIHTNREWINEWKSPFSIYLAKSLIYFPLIIFGIFCYIYAAFKRKENFKTLDWTKFLVLLATMILALKYMKFNVLFLISAFIFIYEDFLIVVSDIEFLINKVIPKKLTFEALIYLLLILYSIMNIGLFYNKNVFFEKTLRFGPTDSYTCYTLYK